MDGKKVTALVIGDPHFKNKIPQDERDFVERSISVAKKEKPTFIVVLGDTLDTHEVVKVEPHNMATNWLSNLSNIAPVFLLIGNHDLINASQFLSDKHIFNPLKKWKNFFVVDKPLYKEFGELSFVFCPYVERGRFVEALNTLITEGGETWEMADCIFAHQEFRGCSMNKEVSSKGDIWDLNYPPVISGHIHEAQVLGNIYMPGSAYQHRFGESPDKRLWFVTFGESEDPGFSIKKIDLGMKKKKIVPIDIGDIEKLDSKILENFHVKLELTGSQEQFKVFRGSKRYQNLKGNGVNFGYVRKKEEGMEEIRKKKEDVSFSTMLKKIIPNKSQEVQDIFKEIMEEEPESPCRIIFISDEEGEEEVKDDEEEEILDDGEDGGEEVPDSEEEE